MNAHHYNEVAKKKGWSPLVLHNNSTICGFWWFGHWYTTGKFKGKYFYGAYPSGYLERIETLFVDEFKSGKILHLFSGTLKGDGKRIITLDIRPELEPNVVGNAEEVDRLFDANSFDLILADPPYDDNYKKYNTKPFSRKKVISACSHVIKPKGYLVWLDTIIPQWRNADGWRYIGSIGVAVSTNHKVRAVTILTKR